MPHPGPRHAALRAPLALAVLLAALQLAEGGQLSTRTDFAAAPGSTNEVDILLDDATGVASIALKVNYDPALLELLCVTNRSGDLGSSFSMQSRSDDGTASVVLTRPDALDSGSGSIAKLVFRINPGATPGMSCDLPLVRHELGGQYGVALDAGPAAPRAGGRIWIVSSMSSDSDGDGIPDAWEIVHFGGMTNAAPDDDEDGDGQSNVNEFRCGTNPHDGDDVLRIKQVTQDSPSRHGLVIRWASVATTEYTIDRSTNLISGFEGIASNILTGGVEGSYTDDTATVEGPYFYRILVK